ncbi:hypothetical protein Nepgr_000348 [Nepenthes gracilis]|uniref:Uncharacterized protein n=1 Tax=Nepenthes gracilis TaxID=150966 RepID=A0AAD3P666_NEPGR|nr:hypothetical protein Nepgr_000348 [Nepenthes gracilis]
MVNQLALKLKWFLPQTIRLLNHVLPKLKGFYIPKVPILPPPSRFHIRVEGRVNVELPSKIRLYPGQNSEVGLESCVEDEKYKVEQEDLHNSSSQEDAPTHRSNAGSIVNSVLQVDAEEPCQLVGSDIHAQAANNWRRNLSSNYESDIGVPNSDVLPESYSADSQKLEASEAVSMVQAALILSVGLISSSVDRHVADSKLEYHAESAKLQCPAGSIPMDKSKEREVVVAHNVDIAINGDLDSVVLPLNAVRVGVEHLGIPIKNNQTQIGSSYLGVAVDHHGEDQGSCSNIGKLTRNIKEFRKKLGASRPGVFEDSYNPGQSLIDGSGSVRNCSKLIGVSVINDCLLQNDNPASALISEEHLVDDVGISGSKGFGTETPSPLPVDGDWGGNVGIALRRGDLKTSKLILHQYASSFTIDL